MIRTIVFSVVAGFLFTTFVSASLADQIGFAALQSVTTNLNGSGIRLAQPEAEVALSPPAWEIDPAGVGQPVTLFSYASDAGTATNYPNTLGANSGHAEAVGGIIYGISAGLATNLAHVDSLEANYFYSNYVGNDALPAIDDAIVNQSFTFGAVTSQVSIAQEQQLDSQYDNYAVQNNTLFVSAPNNGGPVCPPGTAYNSLSVAAFGVDSGSSYGPTLDNGRCKPDIAAPAPFTSFSTPVVSGVAALIMQAAARGDGGTDTVSAGDMRTVRALLLNGAVKPADWTNAITSPLDARYGAGVVNVFNAYEQLAGGKHGYSSSVEVSQGADHPPGTFGNPIGALRGWDFNTNTSSAIQDSINHYYFDITNAVPGTVFTATATLEWNRAYNPAYMINPGTINNLNLYLYNVSSGNLVASSVSTVDNVQQVYVPRLPAGRYDLQVWKAGGISISTPSETYALAFDFFSSQLSVSSAGGTVVLAWPLYPDGFGLAGSTNLLSPQWSTNNLPAAVIMGGTNVVTVSATSGYEFFRLQRPDF